MRVPTARPFHRAYVLVLCDPNDYDVSERNRGAAEWKRLSLIKTARHSMANLERGSEQRARLARLLRLLQQPNGVYEPWRLCSKYAGAVGTVVIPCS